MNKTIILSLLSLAVSTGMLRATGQEYVTAFTGTNFTLIFPAPNIAPQSRVFRDCRWAIDVVEVRCDDKVIAGFPMGSSGIQSIQMVSSGGATLIYSCPISNFIVAKNVDLVGKTGDWVDFRVPEMTNKVVVRYRVRAPDAGVLSEIYTVTAYLRPYFPTGAIEEPSRS
jgi:hypothetical protein